MATIEDVIQFRDELKEKFGGTENVAYANISETQLSIAKYSFGAKIHGKHYVVRLTNWLTVQDLKFEKQEQIPQWLSETSQNQSQTC